MSNKIKPFISSAANISEITLRGALLSVVLAMVLSAANTYLGLKVGITITGSIPAAIISMAILRIMKNSTILENNIVQTAASAGDTLAAGAIFTLPAIVIVKYWLHFDFFQSFIIIFLGGVLGVIYSIPLRRSFINDETLKFPEGIAIGNVLKASSGTSENAKKMVVGSVISATISLLQNGIKVLSDSAWAIFKVGSTVIGVGTGFDMAVIGAGYIVGINIGISILVGSLIAWLICLPLFGYLHGINTSLSNTAIAIDLWSNHIRYVGVGTMSIGGIWALFTLFNSVLQGIQSSLKSLRMNKNGESRQTIRTERDIPLNYVLWAGAIVLLLSGYIFHTSIESTGFNLSAQAKVGISILMIFIVMTLGFILSAICCYLAGLVGSSSNPVSGLIITGTLVVSLMLTPILVQYVDLGDEENIKKAVGISIVVISMIGAATAIAQDNIQDLKAGQLVGATPWKQQVMLLLGVLAAAIVVPPTLDLLFNAYGIGGNLPHPGMDQEQMLAAPQAALVASVAKGVFGSNLPWGKIGFGAAIGLLTILVDKLLNKKGKKLPVLAVGIGIYLPSTAAMTLVIGGIISYFVHRGIDQQEAKSSKSSGDKNTASKEKSDNYARASQVGVSIASGFVCGGALMGIVQAVPMVVYGSSSIIKIFPEKISYISDIMSMLTIVILTHWFHRTVVKQYKKS